MTKTKRPEPATEDLPNDGDIEGNESNKPDYFIKQYRHIRTDNGTRTRKESIGAIWQDAATGMLTIRLNGVQVISNDVFAYPAVYDFKS